MAKGLRIRVSDRVYWEIIRSAAAAILIMCGLLTALWTGKNQPEGLGVGRMAYGLALILMAVGAMSVARPWSTRLLVRISDALKRRDPLQN